MVLLEQLKLLVNLAHIDGQMGASEKTYILNIGKANGFPESSVETLFYAPHDAIVPHDLSDEQKFNYIFSLVQLMKIDERLYDTEIKYCASIATKLGFKSDVLFDLILHVKSGKMNEEEISSLKKIASGYLIS